MQEAATLDKEGLRERIISPHFVPSHRLTDSN
jgi:hypothetical protein